jgi:glucosamine--fructose-6-phosphate aminotransferase (isomerizing)
MYKANYDNAMRRQLLSVPALIRDLYEDLEQKTRTLLSTPEIYGIKKIILTGSGDCYAAALSTQPVFQEFLQIPVEAVSSMDLARGYPMKWVGESPGDPLVIAMSGSGMTARTIEAVERMSAHKALTLSMTKNAQSILAAKSERTLILDYPDFEPAPGGRDYAMMLLCCYLLAIRFGEVRLKYTMDAASRYRRGLLDLARTAEASMEEWDETAFKAACEWKGIDSLEAVGNGYEKGSAWYLHAKAYEAVGIPAAGGDSENWFHLGCFLKNIDRTLLCLFAEKDNPGASRNSELLIRLKQMGRSFLLVTNDPDCRGTTCFIIPFQRSGFFLPLVEWIPPSLVISYISRLRGEAYNRGFEGIWREDGSTPSSTISQRLILD